MQQAEIHDDRIELFILERQRLGVACSELDTRMSPAGRIDHRRRKVDADHLRATRRGGGRNESRTSGDIEQSDAEAGADRVEQVRSGLPCQAAERVGIKG